MLRFNFTSNYKILRELRKRNMKNNFKIAVITGGTGRIGSVFLNELILQNYKIYLLSRYKKITKKKKLSRNSKVK